jgi:hypothetical protein
MYPLNQIACPIAVFHGGRDTLLDTAKLLSQLPRHTWICEEETYEHMGIHPRRSLLSLLHSSRHVVCCVASVL